MIRIWYRACGGAMLATEDGMWLLSIKAGKHGHVWKQYRPKSEQQAMDKIWELFDDDDLSNWNPAHSEEKSNA